jgi:membrane associated rhomboid family serine protease
VHRSDLVAPKRSRVVGRVAGVARRFQLSVPKRRADDDPWFRIGTVDVTTGVFLIGLSIISMFLYAVNRGIVDRLFLFRPFVTDGEVWRLITWPFATEPSIGAAITLAFFWFVSREVERQFGRIRFTKFLLTIAVVMTVLALLLDVPLGGIRMLSLATFLVFVAENPRMPFFFGIPAWVLAVVYVGIDVLQLLGDRQPRSLVVLLAAIATALLLLRGYGWGSEVPWVPRLPVPPILGGPVKRRPAKTTTRATKPAGRTKAKRESGTVVSGPWGEQGTGTATGAAADAPRLPRTGPVTQADVDLVLDKVAATGLASLTDDERAVLEHASRTLRDRSAD